MQSRFILVKRQDLDVPALQFHEIVDTGNAKLTILTYGNDKDAERVLHLLHEFERSKAKSGMEATTALVDELLCVLAGLRLVLDMEANRSKRMIQQWEEESADGAAKDAQIQQLHLYYGAKLDGAASVFRAIVARIREEHDNPDYLKNKPEPCNKMCELHQLAHKGLEFTKK